MEKIRGILKAGAWWIVEFLGVAMFIYTFMVGLTTIYNEQRLGAQMRQVFASVDESTDMVLAPKRRK